MALSHVCSTVGQVGFDRFKDWVNHEGYSGSSSLFRYYQDTIAHVSLLNEMSVRPSVLLHPVGT